jgi:hypothetical protein
MSEGVVPMDTRNVWFSVKKMVGKSKAHITSVVHFQGRNVFEKKQDKTNSLRLLKDRVGTGITLRSNSFFTRAVCETK